MKTANVRIKDNLSGGLSKTAYSFITDIMDLEKGDTVVVDTVNGYHLGVFINYAGDAMKATKYIVQKVDIAAHVEKIKRIERNKSIISEIEKRAENAHKIAFYEGLAKQDDEIAELLRELKENGGF